MLGIAPVKAGFAKSDHMCPTIVSNWTCFTAKLHIVRYWHLADIHPEAGHVRSWGLSGHP